MVQERAKKAAAHFVQQLPLRQIRLEICLPESMQVAVLEYLHRRVAVCKTERRLGGIRRREVDALYALLRHENDACDQMLLGHRVCNRADLHMYLILRRIVGRNGNVLLLRCIHRIRCDCLELRAIDDEIQSLITVDLDQMLLVCKIKY